ncbi:MAG TPA: UDP-N-acetylglucosamine 1-carboxyvinyltransferase [Candidatus Paceibacterota bacterium]|nr:UDP-N-acetylglucosamine 1-carboxyvinyltransferase [Candidatus Paceibacterota bacterium]
MKPEKFLIEGLAGQRKLRGAIAVGGAKNAILKSMPAALLFDDAVHLTNVPDIEDVERVKELLEAMGATVERTDHALTIATSAANTHELDDAIARRLRASIVFAGPVLARFGKVSFPHPGGDVIGPRPIDLFLQGFRAMGCEVSLDGERYTIAARGGRLRGAEIFFRFVSVTGTETLMMAAVLAEGTTVLRNAAMEPEIVALAEFLNSCGANIRGVGTPTITIQGGSMLHAGGKFFATVPDRIEAGSFVILGAIAGEEVTIEKCEPLHIEMLVELLRESGVDITVGKDSVTVRGGDSAKVLQPLSVRTHEYPGFATDLQPPMVVYLTQCAGESTLFETIYGGRLNYIHDLVRMGADITLWNPQQITVKGPSVLHGRELESPDIRAGLAFLLAAAVAHGTSTIDRVYHIDRGYEKIEERLARLGLSIRREQV